MKRFFQNLLRHAAAFLAPLGEDYDMEFVQDIYAPFRARAAVDAICERTFA